MIEFDTSCPRRPDLNNYFYECHKCGHDHRIDFYDQVIICHCGGVIQLSVAHQTSIRKRKEEMRALLAAMAEKLNAENE